MSRNAATEPRQVWNDETGEERTVTHGCQVCGVTDLTEWAIIVSPSGVAHFQHEDGFEKMKCGANGAADGWWWPV